MLQRDKLKAGVSRIKQKENGGTINRIWNMYIIDKDKKSLQCLEHVEVSLILHMLNWKCWDGTEVKLYS